MAKQVYIIHGWDGRPEEPMLQWMKKRLEEADSKVIIPEMPSPSKPEIVSWVKKIRAIANNPNKETYFIGHSVGCQAILRYLETLSPNRKVGGVVLIAPWMELDENTIREEGEEVIEIAKPWMETPIDWNKVKSHTSNFVCLFSENDPYVPLKNKEMFKSNLNAKIIQETNKGHYSIGDNITENQTAVKELLEFSPRKV